MKSATDDAGGGAGADVIDDRRDHMAQSASVPGSAGSCDGSADRLCWAIETGHVGAGEYDDRMKRITVSLPDDLVERIKLAAGGEGQVSSYVAGALADYQEREGLEEILAAWRSETPIADDARRQIAAELDAIGLTKSSTPAASRPGEQYLADDWAHVGHRRPDRSRPSGVNASDAGRLDEALREADRSAFRSESSRRHGVAGGKSGWRGCSGPVTWISRS